MDPGVLFGDGPDRGERGRVGFAAPTSDDTGASARFGRFLVGA